MIKRDLEDSIIELAKVFPVIAILGPRQSGKTTLSKNIFKNHKYVSLEDFSNREEAEKDPKGFLKSLQNEHGIILDEFQHVPKLLSYIQLDVDENRQRYGYFILTGSQNFLMNKAIGQTLAGRVAITTLLPLSITELKQADLLPETIEELVFKGGYPEFYVNANIRPVDWFTSYIKTYVERDVRDLKNIENLSIFIKFMKLCAARIGQVTNITSLANDAEITLKTALSWLSILEASYIIFFLQPYSSKFTRRLIKSPKLYFFDSGLACSLLGLDFLDNVKISIYRGNLIENLIISDILKIYTNANRPQHMYFLRDKIGHEVDCVIEKPNQIIPIEIKARMTTSMSLFSELNFWQNIAKEESINLANGFVVYSGTEIEKRSYGTFISWQNMDEVKKSIL